MNKKEKISGIYKWINKVNLKYYVGSSKDMITESCGRKYHHRQKLRTDSHYNKHLQRAWNKYGEESFEFIIVERGIPENELLVVEQKYLDIAKLERDKCYNQSFIAGKVEMTEEVKAKISRANLGSKRTKAQKQQFSLSHMGIKHSQRTKKQISINTSGSKNHFYNKKHSNKTKTLMSEKQKLRLKNSKLHPMYDHNIYTFYNTRTNKKFIGTKHDFYTKYNLSSSKVCVICNGKRKSHKGWILL